MVYLHVTFHLDVQDVERFETFYAEELYPVIQRHGFEAVWIFKTLVGVAGEFTEIWRVRDLQDYERDSLACNVLALGDEKLLTIVKNGKTNARLEKEGFEVLTYEASEISANGSGGPTCLTRPIWRG